MKVLTKKIIRIWFALSSLFIFGIGYITLSHAENKAAAVQPENTFTVGRVELAPVASLDDFKNNPNQSNTNTQGFKLTATRLRTKGS